jgi:cobalt/nickel transport system permease protein
MGLSAAFVFAAQMLNFPVAGGTSGHLMGGVLAAALLGPGPAVLVLACVLAVQCFLFADGGLFALGANVFNMAVAAPVSGYAVATLVGRILPGERGRIAAIAFGAWCSTVLAAMLCAGELAWSGTTTWPLAFPAMTQVHMIIGLGDGLITALVYHAVVRTRPDLVSSDRVHPDAAQRRVLMFSGVLVTLGLAVFVAPFASAWPDGLERVAAQLGFDHAAIAGSAPLADYTVPWVPWSPASTALAGVAGACITFVLALVLARAVVPRTPEG